MVVLLLADCVGSRWWGVGPASVIGVSATRLKILTGGGCRVVAGAGAPASGARRLSVLSGLYRYAVKEGVLDCSR